ncbi:hypothetical protein ACLOJK_034964 [Asimina triloba]
MHHQGTIIWCSIFIMEPPFTPNTDPDRPNSSNPTIMVTDLITSVNNKSMVIEQQGMVHLDRTVICTNNGGQSQRRSSDQQTTIGSHPIIPPVIDRSHTTKQRTGQRS